MAIIINIETSQEICSVAVSRDGMVEFQRECDTPMQQAAKIGPFIEECMGYLKSRGLKPDAVAVSIGPGSYTGLRIGLSAAKGLCFGLDVPLITVPTLEILAVKAMFRKFDFQGDELLLPMIDARRMEVYTALYDFRLDPVMEPQPLVLTEETISRLPQDRQIYFMGEGSDKAVELLKGENLHHMQGIRAYARDMVALSEKYLREGKIADTGYAVPLYLKEYEAKKSRNKVLEEIEQQRCKTAGK